MRCEYNSMSSIKYQEINRLRREPNSDFISCVCGVVSISESNHAQLSGLDEMPVVTCSLTITRCPIDIKISPNWSIIVSIVNSTSQSHWFVLNYWHCTKVTSGHVYCWLEFISKPCLGLGPCSFQSEQCIQVGACVVYQPHMRSIICLQL